jgi:hypothetical protein
MSVLTPVAKMQFIDAAGVPLAGGLLYTYAAGTTDLQATYTDSTGATPNTNPIVMDSRGEANVWLGSATYKFKLCDADNNELWTVDNISAPTASLSPVLSGNVTIDSDSSGPALKITQTGTGPVLRVQDSIDPDATPFIIDAYGSVGIGTQSPAASLDVSDGEIQLTSGGIARTVISADASNSTFSASSARGMILKTNGTNRITISDTGATTLTGATTFSGGISGNTTVTGTLTSTGALTVSAGGASITGNSTVTGTLNATSTLTAQNGLTVSAGGAGITGTLTANSGVTVPSGGVNVTGTVTATTFSGAWANIPTGTAMLFAQTTAPTGWTKSTTHNDKALRVVSGAASSGGTLAFSTAFAARNVTGTADSYALTIADIPAHTHTATVTDPGHSHTYNTVTTAALAGAGSSYTLPNGYPTASTTTSTTGVTVSIGSSGLSGGHIHGINVPFSMAVQYVDVIIATKA